MSESFTSWIKKQHKRDDATGDIARDVRADHCWPKGATTRQAFVNHLRYNHQAIPRAITALERAYREWEALDPNRELTPLDED